MWRTLYRKSSQELFVSPTFRILAIASLPTSTRCGRNRHEGVKPSFASRKNPAADVDNTVGRKILLLLTRQETFDLLRAGPRKLSMALGKSRTNQSCKLFRVCFRRDRP
jgi:hypothetical protein